MYQTLYRKYRPSNLDEVVGQKVITTTLKNAIIKNQLSHAYLFTGPRGTGKTSIAKILARTINCTNLDITNPCNKCVNCIENNNNSIDIIEIDAASNNGVDEIRELKSKVNLVPSINKYKVYIIDEVHMLSNGAFNALLKTLEEPPSHVIFILATTEPHKIPMTILSRCQRFDFKRLNEKEIIKRLKFIAENENIKIDQSSLEEIARIANGGMRDAISILDQVNAYCNDKITLNDLYEISGTLSTSEIKIIIEYLQGQNLEKLLEKISEYDELGKDFLRLTQNILYYLRNLLLKIKVPNYYKSLNLNFDDYDINIELDELIKYIDYFNKMSLELKSVSNSKLLFELNIIKMANRLDSSVSKKIEKNDILISSSKKIKSENIINQNILEKLINIRVNNTLCNFDKKYYLEVKEKINEINRLVIDPNYNKYASLILDGQLKAAGNEYLIFVFNTDHETKIYNENIQNIDNMLYSIFKEKYKTIAVNIEKWNTIKDEFNNKKKKYTYIEEPINLINELYSLKEENSIELSFGNIVKYD